MKKVTFKNSRGLSLAGNLQPSDSKSIIILVHGFTGDKSERGRFDGMADSLNRKGYATIAFDFSGCGESDDDTLTVGKEVDDLKSAIRFVKSKGYKNIGLLTHSLGGLIALKTYNDDIKTMVLWAPVTDRPKYTWDEKYSKERLEELEEKGYFTKTGDKGVRKRILVDEQMLKDRESVDQKKLLEDINCPVMIIHGNKDPKVPYKDSENAIKLLSDDSKLELIPGADHGFWGHLDKLFNLSTDWFLEHLKP